ncbi:MAG: hypothetical protein M3N95_02980 [Actinomycetota bacterium]|nr:hypothetical protein [Actinomycetota bacterium]
MQCPSNSAPTISGDFTICGSTRAAYGGGLFGRAASRLTPAEQTGLATETEFNGAVYNKDIAQLAVLSGLNPDLLTMGLGDDEWLLSTSDQDRLLWAFVVMLADPATRARATGLLRNGRPGAPTREKPRNALRTHIVMTQSPADQTFLLGLILV